MPKKDIDVLSKDEAVEIMEKLMKTDKLKINMSDYEVSLQSNLPLNLSLNLKKLKNKNV